jgi:hypothetical protein
MGKNLDESHRSITEIVLQYFLGRLRNLRKTAFRITGDLAEVRIQSFSYAISSVAAIRQHAKFRFPSLLMMAWA